MPAWHSLALLARRLRSRLTKSLRPVSFKLRLRCSASGSTKSATPKWKVHCRSLQRPLNVDPRRRPNVSNAQIAVVHRQLPNVDTGLKATPAPPLFRPPGTSNASKEPRGHSSCVIPRLTTTRRERRPERAQQRQRADHQHWLCLFCAPSKDRQFYLLPRRLDS